MNKDSLIKGGIALVVGGVLGGQFGSQLNEYLGDANPFFNNATCSEEVVEEIEMKEEIVE